MRYLLIPSRQQHSRYDMSFDTFIKRRPVVSRADNEPPTERAPATVATRTAGPRIVLYHVPWQRDKGAAAAFGALGARIGSVSLESINCFKDPKAAAAASVETYPTVVYHPPQTAGQTTLPGRAYTGSIGDVPALAQALTTQICQGQQRQQMQRQLPQKT